MYEYAAPIGTVIAAAFAAYGSVYIANRQISKDERHEANQAAIENRRLFFEELNQLRSENKELRETLAEEKRSVAELQARLIVLESEFRHKIALYESTTRDLPLPMWIKDSSGKVLDCNPTYELTFLAPNGKRSRDYIGNTDADVYPADIAEEYRNNDYEVWSTGNTWVGTETVQIGENRFQWRIMKYVRYAGSMKLGIAGIAWPTDD